MAGSFDFCTLGNAQSVWEQGSKANRLAVSMSSRILPLPPTASGFQRSRMQVTDLLLQTMETMQRRRFARDDAPSFSSSSRMHIGEGGLREQPAAAGNCSPSSSAGFYCPPGRARDSASPGAQHARDQERLQGDRAQSSANSDAKISTPLLGEFVASSTRTNESHESDLFCSDENEPEAEHEVAPGPREVTLMVRNIPIAYTQEMLLQEWPNDGSYDFLYLPLGTKGPSNLGYAFINFVNEEEAVRFRKRWQRKKLTQVETKRLLNISNANLQGLEANIQALQGKPIQKFRPRSRRPFILLNGREVSLEDIT